MAAAVTQATPTCDMRHEGFRLLQREAELVDKQLVACQWAAVDFGCDFGFVRGRQRRRPADPHIALPAGDGPTRVFLGATHDIRLEHIYLKPVRPSAPRWLTYSVPRQQSQRRRIPAAVRIHAPSHSEERGRAPHR